MTINSKFYHYIHRRLDSGNGSYTDEGLYIERRSTASDSRGSSRGSSGFNSGVEEQVPDAFTYVKPTKEELESSKPIPPHIVS